MRTLTGGKRELVRRLAAMPFLDRLEMAALSGWSQSAVYEAARQLEDAGLIASVPHGTELVAPTAGSTSPETACAAWPRRKTSPRTACSAATRWRPGGGAASWKGSTPWPWSIAWPPPSPTSNTPSASAGTAPCRWTPPSPFPTEGPSASSGWVSPPTAPGSPSGSGGSGTGRSPAASCSSSPTRPGCATPEGCCAGLPRQRSSLWSGRQRPPTTPSGGCPRSAPPSA